MTNNIDKFLYAKPKKGTVKIFTNAILVDPENEKEFEGELLVEDGVIKDIAEGVGKISSDTEKAKNAELIDCNGYHLAPSLVEIQCHIGEPSGEYKENLYQTTKSAIAGGITTVNIMPDTDPVIDTTTMVEFIKNRAKNKSYCNVTIFGSITKGLEGKELSEIGLLKKAGAKGVSEGNRSVENSLIFLRACEYASNFGMKIVQQPQDSYLSSDGVLNEGEVATRLGVSGMSDIAEKIGLVRDITIATKAGVEYHALNISSAKSVKVLQDAKKNNDKITASVTPHHIFLTEEKANNFRTFAKTDPPLRLREDNKSLIEGLKNGYIDFISCNNMPRSEGQKRLPLADAEFGVIGLETMFSASCTALSKEGFAISSIIKLLSLKPAEFLGLKNKGKLSIGSVADLFLFDISSKWTVKTDSFAGKATNSPFDGEELEASVLKTFIAGEKVYEKIL